MKTLEDQMSFYAAYHQDARNKATRFVGVPLIVLSLLVPLGLAMSIVFALMLWAAEVFVALSYKLRRHNAVQRRALEMRAQAGTRALEPLTLER